jgi:hypothetical protein
VSEHLEDEILRLKALKAVQSADVSALLLLCSANHKILSKVFHELPAVGATFLRLRKKLLHTQLEQLENTQPALAARIQQMIDEASTLYPFDYDEV